MNGAGRMIGVDGEGRKPRLGMAWEIGRRTEPAAASASRGRSSRPGRRSMRASALLVCVAAIVMISSVALVSLSSGNAKDGPGGVLVRQGPPPPPYNVQGYVYLSDGVTPAVNCIVNITNKNTGSWNLTVTDPDYGWYEFDLLNLMIGGVSDGDIINVTATKDLDVGWAEGTAMPSSTPSLDMNVVMSGTVIPEFPVVVLPIVGLMALFTVVSLKRRRDSAQ